MAEHDEPIGSAASSFAPNSVPVPAESPGKAQAAVRNAQGARHPISGAAEWARFQRTRAEEALRTRRRSSALIDAGFEIQELDTHVGGGVLAGAVAFRMFLFLVPFVFIVFTVFDAAARAAGDNPSQAAKSVGITGVLASAVIGTSPLSTWSQVLLVLGAAVALVITANSLVKTLYVTHWLIWRTPRVKPRGYGPILVAVVIALAFTVFGIAVNGLRRTGAAGVVMAVLLTACVAFLVWWWVSWLLPHAGASSRALIPGAVFMAIGVEVLHALTTYWIGNVVARKSHAYGAVGIALAVLLWVYILGRIIIGAAGINATLWRRSVDHEWHSHEPGDK